jgi:hypothetical protein
MITGGMEYVYAAYLLTGVVLSAYGFLLWLRIKKTTRQEKGK